MKKPTTGYPKKDIDEGWGNLRPFPLTYPAFTGILLLQMRRRCRVRGIGMLFNSWQYLIFFPIVVLTYFFLPKRIKNIWLLVASYYFYMGWNAKYVVLLFFTTIVTYAGALILEKYRRKWILFLTIGMNFSILFYFKYVQFAWDNVGRVCRYLNIPFESRQFDILLPVGISFFTFQAIGYTIDVYRREIYAERNLLKYGLFVSFFPQLVAGPIERSKNLLKQLDKTYSFSYDRMREGLLLMLWGFFLKLVIADRAAVFVDTIFEYTGQYGGLYIVAAVIFFAFQIYCDFFGYSVIAKGSARILGLGLMDNFDAPYFSKSVAEFWRRWHISLGSWFRDYLYIPLGGSRKGKGRTCLNLMLVFLASGLWHGAAWSYLLWGGLNGGFQVVSEVSKGIRKHIRRIFCIRENSFSHRLFQTVSTFFLIDFTWLFFRINKLKEAFPMLKSIITGFNPWILADESLFQCGLDRRNFQLLLLSIGVLLAADYGKYKGICIHKKILEQDFWFRWLVFAGGTLFILIFGVWGGNYDAKSFIYFQF